MWLSLIWIGAMALSQMRCRLHHSRPHLAITLFISNLREVRSLPPLNIRPLCTHLLTRSVHLRNTPMDFPKTVTIHPRTPIDHVIVPASVVGGKPFDIKVVVKTPAQSYLTRVDFKWTDPKGLVLVNNQPVSVQSGYQEVVTTFQTKPTPKSEDVEVTISTLPDNPITKKIKIESH